MSTVWVETLIQYLLCDKADAERPNFEGAKYVMSPLPAKNPIKTSSETASAKVSSSLATDQAPALDFGPDAKTNGPRDFTKIPNGIPSLEDRINFYYHHGVQRGRIDPHQFVNTASTQAAKIFGLYPRKGAIQPGSDADLVVYDPTYRGKISAATHHMNLDYNAFEGHEIEGRLARGHSPAVKSQ